MPGEPFAIGKKEDIGIGLYPTCHGGPQHTEPKCGSAKRKGCGAQRQTGQKLARAALRFARLFVGRRNNLSLLRFILMDRAKDTFLARLHLTGEVVKGMIKTFTFVAAGAALFATGLLAQEETPDHRLRSAASVFHEMISAPDKGIPRDLLEKSQCVIIVPGLKKAGFIFGADYGKGFAACRHAGGWTGPAAITLGGGSFGAQIGVESTDVIMLLMDRKGMEKLASDKFTVGADASVAAGPVGRTTSADTDASLHAEILSWSRAHGVFAGVSLDGTVVKKDGGEDQRLYGMEVSEHAILYGEVPPPAAGKILTAELSRFPREHAAR